MKKKSVICHFPAGLIAGWLLFMASCAVPSLVVKINTSQDQQAQFALLESYNWYLPQPSASSPASGPGGVSNLQAHLHKAIEQEIAKKGIRKTETQPQLLLAYDVSLPGAAPKPEQSYPAGFGYGLAWQTGFVYDYGHNNIAGYRPVNAYPPGTILIDVIDADTRELIWRGWAEAVVEDYNADFQTVVNYVDDIIDKYPRFKTHKP
ncbi:MAG: DUF4136 domain-containing protein [Adhaeribacter sp.]